jgi:hypothetical protein
MREADDRRSGALGVPSGWLTAEILKLPAGNSDHGNLCGSADAELAGLVNRIGSALVY